MNFAKLVNLAMDCEFGNAVAKLAKWFANLEMGLRIWQWAVNLAKWFAKLAMWFAKLAMPNFAKILQFLCETNEQCMWLANFAMRTEIANLVANTLRNSQWLRTACQHIAKFAMVANCLRTVCENPVLLFFSCLSSCLQLHLISSTFPLFFY